jgi:hypothetical protein
MAIKKPYRAGGKPDPTGRSHGEPKHVRFYEWMLKSAAYRALRPIERALLTEFGRLHNGINNGQIALGEREAAKLLGVSSKEAASRALLALEAHGFIAKTKASAFNLKDRSESRATEWRLEWLDVKRTGKQTVAAKKTFMRWPNIPPADK